MRLSLTLTLVLVLVGWLLLPLSSIIIGQRTIYDNFRHLLFLLPPLFLMAGFAIQAIFQIIKIPLMRIILILALGLSGWISMLQLHPYEYVYYNQFIGGLPGASQKYLLDYWAVSFRSAAIYLNQVAPEHATVTVCGPVTVLRSDGLRPDIKIVVGCSGKPEARFDYAVIQNLYGALDKYPDVEVVYQDEKQGVIFSVVKKSPSPQP